MRSRFDLQRAALTGAAIAVAVALASGHPARALAQGPFWRVTSEAVPTNLAPGAEAQLIVAASNLGDLPANGTATPLTITDVLPTGLKALSIQGQVKNGSELKCSTDQPPTPPLTCTFAGVLYPYQRVAMTIRVRVEKPPETLTTVPNTVTVEGAGGQKIESVEQVQVGASPTPFGLQQFELAPLNENGTPATPAGAQPFQLTTTLVTNQTAARQPVALPKDLRINLPAGLIGNPNAATRCSEVDFAALVDETNLCSPASAVGVATVTANEPVLAKVITKTVPVFDLVPAQGEPARLGFDVIGKIPIVIDTSVRAGRDYGVVATVRNATQTAGLLSSQVTLWGVPGDPRHNNSRGWECVAGGEFDNQINRTCPATPQESAAPFLRTPTSCETEAATEPVSSSVQADSWAEPGTYVSSEYTWKSLNEALGFSGCDALTLTPQIHVAPESEGKPPTNTASTPTGLTVKVKVPQQNLLEPEKLAEADVKDSTVTLPKGLALSTSAANGLTACSEAQVGYEGLDHATGMQQFSRTQSSCPEASKLGIVHIKTPLLTAELEGAVYLATPAPNGEAGQNPFSSLIALYLVAEDPISGVLVKLAGEGRIDEHTLQVSTSFPNTPQVPFEELRLELFGGPKASLSTPATCGAYQTDALFTPWSGTGPVGVSSPAEEFQITSGPGSSPCPAGVLPFSPGFLAQSTNRVAGAYTGFQLELSRPDGDQALSSVAMHLPPGDAATLSSVKQCPEAQANADACPPESLIGEATAVAGLGPEPYTERGGKVYLTGPYGGAPFGLEIVTPAVAGPFNLGTVTVRSKIFINPNNASVTIVSDPLPTQLRGIPLQLKRVLVNVDRPNFEFNPTNCSQMPIDAMIAGDQGASVPVSSPFAVSNCAGLPFKPKLTASTKGHASKANGANFDVKVESKGLGQANIAKVRLQLPKALPARLTTIQKACTEGAFNANPASCREGSVIGQATIHTPVLRNPLTGPAYLVSHGGAAFPDVEFVLQSEGITLVLDGKTQIKNQVTYSKFESAPDAPFTVFETVLPAGPHSALTTNLPEKDRFNLCKSTLSMPTEIVGQNGAVIKQNTKIALHGCNKVRASGPMSRAQLLKRALAACRQQHKHSKARRQACERQARRRYAAKKASPKGAHRGGASHTNRHAA